MKLYSMHQKQILPTDLETAWQFFSNPANLQKITPENMKFRILSELPEEIYAGLIVQYRLNPIPGIPVTWVTEITQVDPRKMFIDEQRFGPYRFWHHQHFFRPVFEGVEIEDLVHYALPFDPLSRIVYSRLVKYRLRQIFDYRREVLIKRLSYQQLGQKA